MAKSLINAESDHGLLDRVVGILDAARLRTVRHVNSEMVLAYWLIGREIVQALQGGQDRASYGAELLEGLSKGLQRRYARGFSVTNLRYFRLFYQAYVNRQPQIRHEARDELRVNAQADGPGAKVLADLSVALAEHEALQGFSAHLSWTHYRTLCRIEVRSERLFYEVEAERNGWSQPELERHIESHVYLRLVKQLFASRYMTVLPSEETLRAEIERETQRVRHLKPDNKDKP